MRKPHGTLRYFLFIPGGGGFFDLDPFVIPDDFGNVIGQPGAAGASQVPADLRIWPLGPQPIGAGNFGQVTIFPISVTFDPVTGNTTDVVLRVQNDSPAPLILFVTAEVPMVSNMGL